MVSSAASAGTEIPLMKNRCAFSSQSAAWASSGYSSAARVMIAPFQMFDSGRLPPSAAHSVPVIWKSSSQSDSEHSIRRKSAWSASVRCSLMALTPCSIRSTPSAEIHVCPHCVPSLQWWSPDTCEAREYRSARSANSRTSARAIPAAASSSSGAAASAAIAPRNFWLVCTPQEL